MEDKERRGWYERNGIEGKTWKLLKEREGRERNRDKPMKGKEGTGKGVKVRIV